ncbi:MAG: hypothetical protein A2252_00265 [Elusimicrobia bacterium RIFOXYA2_FULL_39_19]|nr:MAG: hypothetical protein A2252_00265 [Elusimicrobia bacterium RIFOXYA2_FULL_39_19]
MRKNIPFLIITLVACLFVLGIIKLSEKIKPLFKPALNVKIENIVSFEISSAQGWYSFKNETGVWNVAQVTKPDTAPVYYPAQKAATDLLERLRKASLTDIISENTGRYTEFELNESSAIKVSIVNSKKKKKVFYIGKNGYDFEHFYFRFENKPQVWLIKGITKWAFEGDLTFWRDKTLTAFNKDSLTQIKLTNYTKKPKEIILFSKTSDYWLINDNEKEIPAQNSANLNQLLANFSSLEADGFAKPDEKMKSVAYELELKTKDTSKIISFSPAVNNTHLARVKDNPTLFKVSGYKLTDFKKSKSEFSKQ